MIVRCRRHRLAFSPPRVALASFTLACAAIFCASGSASAETITCGQMITHNTTLHTDLVNCPDNGIVIGADDITLNLNGHVIDGAGGPSSGTGVGIYDRGAHNGVTIEGGTVREFGVGVLLASVIANDGTILKRGRDDAVRRLTTTDNQFGIFTVGTSDSTFERNRVQNSLHGIDLSSGADNRIVRNQESNDDTSDRRLSSAFDGILIEGPGSDHNLVRKNSVSVNSFGIRIANGDDNVVEMNRVTANEFAGIEVSATSGATTNQTVVRKNRVTDNIDLPGGIEGFGDGILVWFGATNTLVKQNFADGNSDDGIDLGGFLASDAPGTTLTKNAADQNGDLGIDALPSVIDGGGNRARGNGNPLQCRNVRCH